MAGRFLTNTSDMELPHQTYQLMQVIFSFHLKQRKLPVIDKFHFNSGFFSKKQ